MILAALRSESAARAVCSCLSRFDSGMPCGTFPSGIKTGGTNSTPRSRNNHQRSHWCRCLAGCLASNTKKRCQGMNSLAMPLDSACAVERTGCRAGLWLHWLACAWNFVVGLVLTRFISGVAGLAGCFGPAPRRSQFLRDTTCRGEISSLKSAQIANLIYNDSPR